MKRRIGAELLLVAAIGVALAAMGPFGTYGLPLATRFAYWLGFLLLGYAVFRPMVVAGDWLASTLRIPGWGGKLLVITVGSVPLALLAAAALRPSAGGPAASDFPAFYFQFWAIGASISFLIHRLLEHTHERQYSSPPLEDPAPKAVRPRLFQRLPPEFGPRLLCLSMEDHYVRAHGERGTTLLLLRLRDAIEELSGLDGLQVHRSWWVAGNAIERLERHGRRVSLVLTNGTKVPVAQAYLEAVRQQVSLGSRQ